MAVSTQSLRDSNDFSLTQDSDEVEEMHCEHCEKLLHKYVPADGFCQNCVEYMCDTCLRYHKQYQPGHSLEDKNTMPQDFYLEKCDVHKHQLIKFFCDNCQKTTCSECKTIYHKKCKNVAHLSTLAKNVENSQELTALFRSIEEVTCQVDGVNSHINSNIQELQSDEINALSTIKTRKDTVMADFKKRQQDDIDNFDDEMEEVIAKLKRERKKLVQRWAERQKRLEEKLERSEDDTLTKLQVAKSIDQSKQQSLKDENLKIQKDVNALSSDLKQVRAVGKRCKLLVTVKKAQNSMRDMKRDTDGIKEKMDNISTRYVITHEVNDLTVESLENTGTFYHLREFPSSRRKRTAMHTSDIKTTSAIYSNLCLLTEITLLRTDCDGECIYIYKNVTVKRNQYNTIKFSCMPWALTKITNHKIAVTFPNEDLIKLITFSDSMTVARTDDISVGKLCHGIAYCNNYLIVSFNRYPGKVKILNMSGTVIKCFDKDSDGKPRFSWPCYLTVSPDNTTIYVCDVERHTVTSLTFDGEVKATYRDDQLEGPRQMTVDEAGTVYVCGWLSNNVHQLSSDLRKVKILLDENQGIVNPDSVTYCNNKNRLYIGMYKSNTIKVFDVSVE